MFHTGIYTPVNPSKYNGKYPIYWRSSWEHRVMAMFDTNPSILEWSSESIKIPYLNPFTGKHTIYIPDFVVSYIDANNVHKTEIIEVKPVQETMLESSKSKRHKMALALNIHKWAAAQEFAKKYGMSFRVMNENNIFNNPARNR